MKNFIIIIILLPGLCFSVKPNAFKQHELSEKPTLPRSKSDFALLAEIKTYESAQLILENLTNETLQLSPGKLNTVIYRKITLDPNTISTQPIPIKTAPKHLDSGGFFIKTLNSNKIYRLRLYGPILTEGTVYFIRIRTDENDRLTFTDKLNNPLFFDIFTEG